LKTITAERDHVVAASAERTPSIRWALASLSLSMLMPSLDTSIANAGLPTLALAFTASFQAVQWIVLAYLLAITTLIVSAGRLGDILGSRRLPRADITNRTASFARCGCALRSSNSASCLRRKRFSAAKAARDRRHSAGTVPAQRALRGPL
jgi:hypothetical protein